MIENLNDFISIFINHVWKSINTVVSNNAFHGTNPSVKITNSNDNTIISGQVLIFL